MVFDVRMGLGVVYSIVVCCCLVICGYPDWLLVGWFLICLGVVWLVVYIVGWVCWVVVLCLLG